MDADSRKQISPPRSLYGKEFLELDYRNIFELLEFQQEWGPITGLRAQPNLSFDAGTFPNVQMNESFYGTKNRSVYHPDGMRKTTFLYEGMGQADIIAKERYGVENQTLKRVVNENWKKRCSGHATSNDIVPCHIATVEEVAEAVCDAQVAIRAITRTLREDYTDEKWKQDRVLVKESVQYCNAVLTGAVDPVAIIEGGDREGTCSLMQHLFINLVKGVMLNNTYRFCQNPECGRLYTPKEYGRRADSKYCSEECQVRAKYLRSFISGKKVNKQPKNNGTRRKLSRIEVSWSTSDIPLRTLRREQYMIPGDKHEPILCNKYEQLLLHQSFLGLTTGRPRTAAILEELKMK